MEDFEKYLKEAIGNIREDRDKAKEFLEQLEGVVSEDTHNHKQLGVIAAKYLETLQRSNEQLVKVVALMQKKQTSDVGLTEKDKDELFDVIKEVA